MSRWRDYPEPGQCRCLCPKTHPADPDVCDGEAVMVLRTGADPFGRVGVEICAPCAAAESVSWPEVPPR